jgi:1-aminocyclopropane-1-carboxylate deaminase/D-cysteine desulfhydrase-like pyridoxal-dependent ACC family enzyme
MEMVAPPAIRLGQWPTPVERVPATTLGEILVKRDDLSGHGRGGVKTRKIEHVVSHLLEGDHDILITAVGNITNLVDDMVPVLRRHGITWEIVVADEPRLPPSERERMFADVGDGVRLLGPSRARVTRALLGATARARAAGRKPFLAAPGLAHPTGVMANMRAYLELTEQTEAMDGPPLETVFITAASGTTLAGFLLAEHMRRRDGGHPIHVIGVQTYPGPTAAWVRGLIRWTEHQIGARDHLPVGQIELRRSRLYQGFGRYPHDLVRLCRSVKEMTGLEIDPIFGGKTWSAMESYLSHGPRRGPVLYWHCGLTPGWERLDELVN